MEFLFYEVAYIINGDKMNWKEFLRPTKSKILLTLLFSFLGYFFGAYSIGFNPIFLIFNWIIFVTVYETFWVGINWLFGIILLIIWNYILSNIIIFIYKKVKK